MKRSRKILIERYVNLRCKKLQEEARLEEWGFDDIKSAASGVVNKAKDFGSKAIDTAKNVGSKAVDTAKNLGSRVKDAATVGAQANINAHNTMHDLATDLGANSKLANLAYITPAAPIKTMYDAYDIGRTGYEKGLGAAAEKTAEKIGGGMDAMQTGLDVVGLAGAIHPAFQVADLANVGISGVRGGIELARGNTDAAKKHGVGALVSGASSIPYIGDAGALGNIGLKWGKPVYNAATAIGKNPLFKGAKYANKFAKNDEKWNDGDVVNTVVNAVDDTATNLAGPSGPFSNIYNYFKGD